MLPSPEDSVSLPGWPTWLALAGILVGWFLLDTLVVRIGPLSNSLKFYDMAAVIADPGRVLFGLDAGHRLKSLAFGAVCAALALAPLLAARLPTRLGAAAYASPLAAMLLCAAVLYQRTSGDLLTEPQQAAPLAHDFLRLANELLNRGAASMSRNVRIGAGAWVSFASSAWLAWQGWRHHPSNVRAMTVRWISDDPS